MADVAGIEQQEGRGSRPVETEGAGGSTRKRALRTPVLLAVLIAAAVGGYFAWKHYSIRETTDDAQIDGHINPISAKVGGSVLAVNVDDNQYVQAGTVLLLIDPRDYRVALDKANADLAVNRATARAAGNEIPITSAASASRLDGAQAGVRAAEAGLLGAQREVDAARAQLGSAQARLREMQARSALAQQTLVRMKQLVERDEISRQQFDASVAEADGARAAVDSARAAIAQAEQAVPVAESHVAQARAALAQAMAAVESARTAPEQVAVSRAQSGSAQAKAQQSEASVAQAELNLEYTTIKAPVNGVISKKSVEVGQVIQPGQPLMAIVPLDDIWVTANFKETQLNHMRPGQPATISVDTYGGRRFKARVGSLAAATGARFSLLPPENATGNYVKVVQRVPVKILFEQGQDPQHLLRPGMSVVATVITK